MAGPFYFVLQATTSATTRAGLHGSFTSARTGSTSKLQGLSRSASGPLLPDRSANSEASGAQTMQQCHAMHNLITDLITGFGLFDNCHASMLNSICTASA